MFAFFKRNGGLDDDLGRLSLPTIPFLLPKSA
jgi:hypothetical protein